LWDYCCDHLSAFCVPFVHRYPSHKSLPQISSMVFLSGCCSLPLRLLSLSLLSVCLLL
jgi:hypothetical protein